MSNKIIDWYDFTVAEKNGIRPEKNILKRRDKVFILCADCNIIIEKQVGNLIERTKTQSSFRCRSCGGKASNTPKARKKFERTCFKNYGVDNPMKNKEVTKKAIETSINKYGKGGSLAKARKAFKERYGVKNPFELEKFREKAKQTNLEKYGCESKKVYTLLQKNEVKTEKELFEKLVCFLEEKNLPCNNPLVEKHFKTVGVVLTRLLHKYDRTDLLYKGFYRSQGEKEIEEFLNSLGFYNLRRGDRHTLGGKEIDVFIKERNIGIEYNGNYWHSFEHKTNSKYHFLKRLQAEKLGVKLLQIRSDEWEDKRPIIESLLKQTLNKTSKRFFARNLMGRIVSRNETSNFLNKNHLMGTFLSGRSLGLYTSDNILVQLFVYKLKHKQTEMECSRICSLKNHSIVGGVSKLLKHALRYHPSVERVISFVDLRYADGHSLKKLGFERKTVTLGWGWTNGKEVFNRLRCRANMDERRLTQKQHAEELKWFKLFDAGQAKFVLKV